MGTKFTRCSHGRQVVLSSPQGHSENPVAATSVIRADVRVEGYAVDLHVRRFIDSHADSQVDGHQWTLWTDRYIIMAFHQQGGMPAYARDSEPPNSG